MFSLIITIISIALVVLLAAATIFYGGSVFSDRGDEAATATLLNEGAQIRAAMEAYKVNEGGLPVGTEEEIRGLLVSRGYLKSFPAGSGDWTLVNDYAVVSDIPDAQCAALNAKYGITATPACDDPAIQGQVVCCTTPD